MAQQGYRNHIRYIPLWHMITGLSIIGMLIGSIVNLVNSSASNRYSASLLVLASLIFGSIFWYARWFALRAQDRAIRAEENLRHFVLTGKLLDGRLTTSQVIALRFASDTEFLILAERAANENLKAEEIKKAIVNWKSDHYRV